MLNDFLADCLLHRPEDTIVHAKAYFASFNASFQPGTVDAARPLVIAGPSGVGKGTMINMLLKDFPETFKLAVSHTSRSPRDGEVDGVHYHFTTKEQMQAEIDAGKFIESAVVHGNLYGTSVAAVADVSRTGRVCILDIDVQGVLSVKKTDLNPRYVFIKPPSMEALEERLRGRGTESDETLATRMATAAEEMKYVEQADLWDAIIENNVLETAYAELKEIIDV